MTYVYIDMGYLSYVYVDVCMLFIFIKYVYVMYPYVNFILYLSKGLYVIYVLSYVHECYSSYVHAIVQFRILQLEVQQVKILLLEVASLSYVHVQCLCYLSYVRLSFTIHDVITIYKL